MAWTWHAARDPGFAAGAPEDVAVAIAMTEDGGESWSAPTIATPDTPTTVEWPLKVLLFGPPEGRVVVVVYVEYDVRASTLRGLDDATKEIVAIRSTDGGRTWDEPIPITPPLPAGMARGGFPPVRPGSNGEALAAWSEYMPGGGQEFHLATSHDEGLTWESQLAAAPEPPTDLFLIGTARAGDGTLGVAWYGNEGNEVAVYLATGSGDGWATREIVRLDAPVEDRGHFQSMVGLSDGFGLIYTIGELSQGHGPTNIVFTRVATTG